MIEDTPETYLDELYPDKPIKMLQEIRRECPGIEVLQIDNVNPNSVIMQEGEEITKAIVKYCAHGEWSHDIRIKGLALCLYLNPIRINPIFTGLSLLSSNLLLVTL